MTRLFIWELGRFYFIGYYSVGILTILDVFRINLTFWDELAHVAYEHVQKGHQIYVSGRLVSDTVENDEGKQQTYYKVLVYVVSYGIDICYLNTSPGLSRIVNDFSSSSAGGCLPTKFY